MRMLHVHRAVTWSSPYYMYYAGEPSLDGDKDTWHASVVEDMRVEETEEGEEPPKAPLGTQRSQLQRGQFDMQ